MTEKQHRIKVALWAFAYEIKDSPLVSDSEYDDLCKQIDLSQTTDSPDMDRWFKDNFTPYTGAWIHNHPNLKRLEEIYGNLK